ncbi:MAG: tetratricopeptide repeat protein [Bdellovibrionota bacterium]
MFKLATIRASANLNKSIKEFQKHFKLNFESYSVNSIEEIHKATPDFLLVHNQCPEQLDALQIMQALRNDLKYCTMPILFLSRKLSEVANLMVDDLEFIWYAPLPFKSSEFYYVLKEINKFVEDNQQLLSLRKQVQEKLSEKKFEEALKILPELQKLYDNHFKIDLLRAEVKYGLDKHEETLENLDFALSKKPHSLSARSLRAATYFRMGDQKKGMEVLATTEKLAEIRLNNLIHWGDTYLDDGNTEASRNAFTSALKIDPNSQKAKEGLVVVDLIEGNINTVKTSIENSSMSFDFTRICNLKGITLVAAEQFDAAERLYQNALKFIKEDEHKIWLNLGLCMKKAHNYEKALHYFQTCLAKAPNNYTRAQEQIEHTQKLMLKHT